MTVKTASLLAAVLLVGGQAHAHPEFSALGTNRYVTAAVLDGRIDVTDALLEGALPSSEARQRLDADGDGTVSETERRAGEARLRAAGPDLGVELDGHALAAPLEVGLDLGGDPRVAAEALVVERRQSLAAALTPGPHRLRITVARDPARVLDTEIGVVLVPSLSLQGSDRVTFQGPRRSALEDRSASFTLTKSAPPAKASIPSPVPVLVVLVLVLVAVLVRLRRRRRSP